LAAALLDGYGSPVVPATRGAASVEEVSRMGDIHLRVILCGPCPSLDAHEP